MSNDIFMQKISNSMGQITQLLVTLEKILDNVPNKNDSGNLNTTLDNLRKEIDSLHSEFSTYLNDNKDLHLKLTKIVNHLENTAALKDPDLILNHIKLEKDLYNKLIESEDSDLKAAGTLAKSLLDEYKTLQIKIGEDTIIKAQDIVDYLEYIKSRSKIHRFWSGWKAKIAIVVGVIIGAFIGGAKIIDSIHKLLDHINSVNLPPGL